jgi:hypothetical protein
MAWPWITIIAKNVPWMELVRRAPEILARSRELLEESRRARPAVPDLPPGDLRHRIELLEERDAEHARIIAAMVEQIQGLTESVRILAARSRVLGWLLAAAVIGQIVTLVFAGR